MRRRSVCPGGAAWSSYRSSIPTSLSGVCVRSGETRISARAEVLTFSRLAQRVFQEKGGSARPVLDKGGRLLLMHLAVRRLRGELNVYRQAGEKAGFLTSLLATADECKSYCIPPELLLEAGESEPERGRRLRELGLVLGAYDALTAQRAEDPRRQAVPSGGYSAGHRLFPGESGLSGRFY